MKRLAFYTIQFSFSERFSKQQRHTQKLMSKQKRRRNKKLPISENQSGIVKAESSKVTKNKEGHEFKSVPKTVAVMFKHLNKKENSDKRDLVDEWDLVHCYDIYHNTIHAIAGEVQITTHKIGNALGLSSKGKAFDEKVSPKELNEEDHVAYKFFQGKSQAALSKLVKETPLDIEENKKLFMRAFVLFIQKCFLLPTSLQTSHRELSQPFLI
ncbi:hypothetical protein PIB30_084647 [Stylosanthes scabra]|uniref:Uncharacterized protein n=1 Tax=Stylosanthes scabra TaxID=79078 RepID=A0ABU6ZR89_9FABA|nr:hypothetical protein [Stylosanthes scabra]